MKPKNQHQQVIYYLLVWKKFSLKDVVNDTMFIKFQTRLSEIEKKHGEIASRDKIKFVNRFGRKSDYNVYSACIDKNKLVEIFKSYN
jgi:hypothetical protein